MTHTIRAGQIYTACHPLDAGRRIRIESYTPGYDTAHIVDADTGQRPRWIQVSQLHASGTTRHGKPRRTGYVLEHRTTVTSTPEQGRPADDGATTDRAHDGTRQHSEGQGQAALSDAAVRPGQVYRVPGGGRIRITAYVPGAARAEAVCHESGEPVDAVLVRYLYGSPLTPTGRLRRTGYVLDRAATRDADEASSPAAVLQAAAALIRTSPAEIRSRADGLHLALADLLDDLADGDDEGVINPWAVAVAQHILGDAR